MIDQISVEIVGGIIAIMSGCYGIARWSFYTKSEINEKDKLAAQTANETLIEQLKEFQDFKSEVSSDLEKKANKLDLERLEAKLDTKADKADLNKLETKLDRMTDIMIELRTIVSYKLNTKEGE